LLQPGTVIGRQDGPDVCQKSYLREEHTHPKMVDGLPQVTPQAEQMLLSPIANAQMSVEYAVNPQAGSLL